MEAALPDKSVGATFIAVLALVQSAFGVLRALHWVDVGSDLMGQGLLLIPLIGIIAFLRGTFVAAVALLYVSFACGAFLRRSWAWWLGMIPAVINLLLVVSVMAQGEAIGQVLLWSIVPVVIIAYLLSGAGRRAFVN
jgi:hypothetical protein